MTSKDVIAAREALGMTREEFSSWTGVSWHTVYNWETGRSQPPDMLERLLQAEKMSTRKGQNDTTRID